MPNKEHVALLKQGAETWDAWRTENPDMRPDLSGADLHRADLRDANLEAADLGAANLEEADLRRAFLFKANLRGANLQLANLHIADLRNANVHEANLEAADVRGANLEFAKLEEANLPGANLGGANLRGANLRYANLEGADLTEARLDGADFYGAKLKAVCFRKAILWRANLENANLTEADLTDANLEESDFTGAQLLRADLRQAKLARANLIESNLKAAVLDRASFERTRFLDTNLLDTKGLESCEHYGPSYIDYQTLEQSGTLPLRFLRGCGLPDNVIDYLPSLINAPIQFYSCFISYSSRDEKFAKRLHADLQDNGVRCWFAPKDMKIGDKIRTRIDEVIRVHEKLLLVLSDKSIDSEWVEKEVETAFERERETKRTVLFPVRLDNSVMKRKTGWAADIKRTRHIGDFRNWKDHDAYHQNLQTLLRDLEVQRDSETSTAEEI